MTKLIKGFNIKSEINGFNGYHEIQFFSIISKITPSSVRLQNNCIEYSRVQCIHTSDETFLSNRNTAVFAR